MRRIWGLMRHIWVSMRRIYIVVTWGIQPEGGRMVCLQDIFQEAPAPVIQVEGIEEDVQLVSGQAAFQQVIQQVNVVRGAEAVEGDDPLLPDQREVDVVAIGFVEERFVIQEDGGFRLRAAVEVQHPRSQLLEAPVPFRASGSTLGFRRKTSFSSQVTADARG